MHFGAEQISATCHLDSINAHKKEIYSLLVSGTTFFGTQKDINNDVSIDVSVEIESVDPNENKLYGHMSSHNKCSTFFEGEILQYLDPVDDPRNPSGNHNGRIFMRWNELFFIQNDTYPAMNLGQYNGVFDVEDKWFEAFTRDSDKKAHMLCIDQLPQLSCPSWQFR